MQYYSSETCGQNGYNGCTTDYAQSEVKYVVDAWKAEKAPVATEARLITIDEVKDNLGYELIDNGSVQLWLPTDSTPGWVYNSNYEYWTMSPNNDSASNVWYVSSVGGLSRNSVDTNHFVVRPVITISKSSI